MLTLVIIFITVMGFGLWGGDFSGKKIRHIIDPKNLKAGRPIWSKLND